MSTLASLFLSSISAKIVLYFFTFFGVPTLQKKKQQKPSNMLDFFGDNITRQVISLERMWYGVPSIVQVYLDHQVARGKFILLSYKYTRKSFTV